MGLFKKIKEGISKLFKGVKKVFKKVVKGVGKILNSGVGKALMIAASVLAHASGLVRLFSQILPIRGSSEAIAPK